MFDPPEKLLDETYTENSADREPVREVCILPFPMNDVLLQGETKELCLYEERYVIFHVYTVYRILCTVYRVP